MQSDPEFISAAGIASFAIHPEGQDVEVGVLDTSSRRFILKLHPDTLDALFALIPAMLAEALPRLTGNPNVSQVFSLAGWQVETARGQDQVVLRLAGQNGFNVSSVADAATTEQLGLELAVASDSQSGIALPGVVTH